MPRVAPEISLTEQERARLERIVNAPRSGRTHTYDAVEEAKIIAKTLDKPPGRTHWSAERLAEHFEASATTTLRIWRRNGLQPHRTEAFKYSTAPLLEEKVADIVGVYLHPPEGALVLWVDEKIQIQALDRTQPKVEAWFEDNPRFERHFTPTSASWMNQVETWFGILTSQAVRRGSFRSVDALTKAIHRFIRAWNDGCEPFVWVKTADQILDKAL